MSKFLFVVQGEGRGHLTQAISLREILEEAGHEIVAIMVGLPTNRTIPSFFFDEISCPIISFENPSLTYSSNKENLSVSKTIWKGISGIGRFSKSIRKIDEIVQTYQPDAIINFYDLLTGIYNFFYRPTIPMICVGHQYLLLKKDFIFPKNSAIDKFFLNLNTQITALRATKKLALSFNKRENDEENKITVVPPLLRSAIKKMFSQKSDEPFILVYMTIPAMADRLIKWHQQNPKTVIHCFCDRIQAEDEFKCEANLTFHKINGQKFLDKMQQCAGLVTTAGFESVSEAMYLGKPVMMIPVKNHFEQACNALDGSFAGAGIEGKVFNLTQFIDYLPKYKNISSIFNEWQNQDRKLFIKEIEDTIFKKQLKEPSFTWQPILTIQGA